MSETTQLFKKQLPKNAAMSVIAFSTYALSAVWLTPYLVKHLGPAAFGLIPLAELLTQYVSIITANLSASVNRFLTIEIQKQNGDPNTIFNSAFALYLLLVLIQLPLFGFCLAYADRIFSIPLELKFDALLLFACSAGGFLISLFSGVFGVSLYSHNRLDIISTINLIRLIFRLLLIVCLFFYFGPQLRFIGFVDLGLSVLMLVSSVYYWKKLTPNLFISLRYVERKLLGPIFKMSMWTIVNHLGSLLYLRTDIWIINRFISPALAGQYAAIVVISNFIRQLGQLFSGQLGPISMRYWARGEMNELRRMLIFSAKIVTVLLAIPVVLICINSEIILTKWLGNDFSSLHILLVIMLIHLPINAGVSVLFQLQTVSNNVKIPAIVTFLMGLLNVLLSYLFGIELGYGVCGVAVATGIVLTMKNAIFTPFYSAKILKIRFVKLFYPLFLSIVMSLIVYSISLVPVYQVFSLERNSLYYVVSQSIYVGILAILIMYFCLFSKHDRNNLLKHLTGNM
jgi:membrane protein EpsK